MISLSYYSSVMGSYLAGRVSYLIFMLPALILVLLAQGMVSARYKRFGGMMNSRGLSGYQAAKSILDAAGVYHMGIQTTSGKLSDHYDPKQKTLFLSQEVYQSSSIAAVGIAAHEVGHALQHAQGYGPLKWRMAMVPVCNFGSKLSLPLMLLGMILASDWLFLLGIVAFSLAVLFQLITLPVEFNASRRAMQAIRDGNLLTGSEADGARKMLTAAAMTYVAALAQSLLTLLYYISRFSSRRRR